MILPAKGGGGCSRFSQVLTKTDLTWEEMQLCSQTLGTNYAHSALILSFEQASNRFHFLVLCFVHTGTGTTMYTACKKDTAWG